ncbi:uncharacterized protein TNCV_4085261 [Trichonephila clavipes]|nr:uncharacterized protein TNCV_4085261 [Trichonephila clavipes]
MGFRSRRLSHLPLLTARYKALLFAWVRQHQHWTVDDGKHVAWSDESHFQLNQSNGLVWLFMRQSHESKRHTCQQRTV